MKGNSTTTKAENGTSTNVPMNVTSSIAEDSKNKLLQNGTTAAGVPLNVSSAIAEDAKNKLLKSINGGKAAGHITLVSPASTNQRVFQSVSDVISDSSIQLCPDGRRDCLNKPLTSEKVDLFIHYHH